MNVEEYARMYRLENSYWWFQGRKSILMNILQQHIKIDSPSFRILDVGCGTGLMMEEIRRRGNEPVGIDFSPLAMTYCQKRGLTRCVRGDVTQLPVLENSCDAIIALDLIEHVEDDHALLGEFYKALRPGGVLLLSVPAYQFLWSEHDDALHHFRRYARADVRRLLNRSRFHVLRFTSAITLTCIPIILFRFLQRLLPRKAKAPKTHLITLPRFLNRLLIDSLEVEAAWLRRHTLPFGISILAMAQKPVSLNRKD